MLTNSFNKHDVNWTKQAARRRQVKLDYQERLAYAARAVSRDNQLRQEEQDESVRRYQEDLGRRYP